MFLRSPKHFKDGKQVIVSHMRKTYINKIFNNINGCFIFLPVLIIQKLVYPLIWDNNLPEFVQQKVILKNIQKIKL